MAELAVEQSSASILKRRLPISNRGRAGWKRWSCLIVSPRWRCLWRTGLPVPGARRAVWICVRWQEFGNRIYNAVTTNWAYFSRSDTWSNLWRPKITLAAKLRIFRSQSKKRPNGINCEAVLDAWDYECRHEHSDDAIQETAARVGETNQQSRTPAAETWVPQDWTLSKMTPRFPTCAHGSNAASRKKYSQIRQFA